MGQRAIDSRSAIPSLSSSHTIGLLCFRFTWSMVGLQILGVEFKRDLAERKGLVLRKEIVPLLKQKFDDSNH